MHEPEIGGIATDTEGNSLRAGKLVVLCAGGTGGHLFPAQALASTLMARGYRVMLITDARAAGWAKHFPGERVILLAAGTTTGAGLLGKLRGLFALAHGFVSAVRVLRVLRPAAMVGFGGYPTLPPLLAAHMLGVPFVIHESNAVMGRANTLLARFAARLATGFPLQMLPALYAQKTTVTGNPVRPRVHEAAKIPYPALDAAPAPLRLVAFAGSQGARVMSEVVPQALADLPPAVRAQLFVTHQAREEQVQIVTVAYAHAGIAADVRPFFEHLPETLAQSHLVIARAGASTLAELAVLGRPAILVPLPGAIDQDQAHNARLAQAAGGAIVVAQAAFTPPWLTKTVQDLLTDAQRLPAMASAMQALAAPEATRHLADQVEGVLHAAA